MLTPFSWMQRALPTCALCHKLLLLPAGLSREDAVSIHTGSGCKLLLARTAPRKNRCMAHDCRQKPLLGITCAACGLALCSGHRFPEDHNCSRSRGGSGRDAAPRRCASSEPAALFPTRLLLAVGAS
jgi:hypothetical protein